jgi:hypothetical protein
VRGGAAARAWLWATAALSAGAFTVAIILAPPASASPARGLGWVLFIASSGHVASTGWFYGSGEVRAHVARHRWRYIWVPLILVLATATAAAALPPRTMAWLLLPYFGWQFFHFQKQNLGIAALAATSCGAVLYGMYLGVVMAHFVTDAGLWRLRDPFPRRFLASRVPYLLRPAMDRQTI